jgi:hypothetical protein
MCTIAIGVPFWSLSCLLSKLVYIKKKILGNLNLHNILWGIPTNFFIPWKLYKDYYLIFLLNYRCEIENVCFLRDYGIRKNYTEVEYLEYKDYVRNGIHRLPIPQLTTQNMLQTRILKQMNTFKSIQQVADTF